MNEPAEEFSRYDGADYLSDLDDAAAYLEATLDEGDNPALIAKALGTIARSGNLSALARRVGMSREGLYKALSADGNPSSATIMKVAGARSRDAAPLLVRQSPVPDAPQGGGRERS